jgi:superfamily II DNA/RNA helicase
MHFEDFALDAQIMAGVRDAGYVKPTPIQEKALPAALSGRDVMGLAQTGTGKTAAFVLPVLQRLIKTGAGRSGPVRALVLAPTRELAQQIHQEFIVLGKKTGHRSAPVFGGVNQNPQVKALRRASICVACPGRLLDLMNQGLADLRKVDVLVLDEADRMLDMGFMPDIKKITAKLPDKRQTLLFSATMPGEIRSLAQRLMSDPAMVRVDNTGPAALVSHALYPVADRKKQQLLEAMLDSEEAGSVLVFTRTKHRAKTLAGKLCRKGWAATSLQGNLSQNRRQEAMSGFKSGKYRVMVATDIAARGIDCRAISRVINFDVPDTAEAYTHRVGRTGRAERSGAAATLVTPGDRRQVRDIERALGRKIDRLELEGFEYGPEEPRGGQDRPAPGGRPKFKGPKPGGRRPENPKRNRA